ncbi:DUF397 domain-containing protein, partial [Streptomyces clavifer]|uniref:DUF397 domain-containing protein n=1 Tax=Streptomyces clavifer TaxID=68188 RepID=UPI003667762D
MSIDGSAGTVTSLVWVTSTYSSNEGGACVEVAATGHAVLVRDSKDLTRPHVTVSHRAGGALAHLGRQFGLYVVQVAEEGDEEPVAAAFAEAAAAAHRVVGAGEP